MSLKADTNTLAQLMDVATIIDREVEATGGELTPEIEQLMGLTEILQSEKVDQYDYVVKRLEAEAEFLKDRAREYAAAAKARSNGVERIRDRIKQLMLIHEKPELAGQYVRFVLSPSIPALVIDNEGDLPAEFIQAVVTHKVDNAGIKAALQTGTPVAGAHLKESYQLRSYAASGAKRLGGK